MTPLDFVRQNVHFLWEDAWKNGNPRQELAQKILFMYMLYMTGGWPPKTKELAKLINRYSAMSSRYPIQYEEGDDYDY